MGSALEQKNSDNFGESHGMETAAQKCRSDRKCEKGKDAKVSAKMCNAKKCKSGCGLRGKFSSTLKLAAIIVLVLLLVTDVNGDRNPNRARKRR